MRSAFGAEFDLEPGYLNTAGIGVPTKDAASAVADSVLRWSRGLDEPADFEESVARARSLFARLVGVPDERVAIGGTVSQLVGLVAASLPAGSEVLVAERDFTSVSFPFAAQRDRGVRVVEHDLDELPARAGDADVVAVSVVQSADGRVVDLEALRAAARGSGTRVLLDVTQAAGWMPLSLDWADWVVGASYKWLLAPRGAAWLAMHPGARDVRPHGASWYAAEDQWSSIYGLPMRLADTARAWDISPAWFAHVGAAKSMGWLAELDMAAVARHCTGLADEFRDALGMPPARSAIVSVDADMAKLTESGMRCSARGGKARLAFHLYNTEQDVQRAVRAVRRG